MHRLRKPPANLERLASLAQEHDLDAIIATNPANVYYLTGYGAWVHWAYREYHHLPGHPAKPRQAYGIFSQADPSDLGLVYPIGMGTFISQNEVWAGDLQSFGRRHSPSSDQPKLKRREEIGYKALLDDKSRNSESQQNALTEMIKRKGLERRTIGVDFDDLSEEVEEQLRHSFPYARFKKASELLRLVRMVKTDQEIAKLRRAAELNEKAYSRLVASCRPGATENELVTVVKETYAKENASFNFVHCIAGTRSGAFFPPSDCKLKRGENVWFDFGCKVDFYNADTGGVVALGRPSKWLEKLYAAAEEAQQSAIDSTAPGVKASQIIGTIQKVLNKHGLMSDSFGHGIGLEIRDYPIFSKAAVMQKISDGTVNCSADFTLEQGMVVNHETPYRELGRGGVQIEHSLVVTKSGCRLLLPQTRKLHIR